MLVPSEFRKFFKPDFLVWAETNDHIIHGFNIHTLRLIDAGRTHYSARTIVEVLVHHSILAEDGDGEFKITNAFAPYLARLFVLKHPQYRSFWTYRRGDWREFLAAFPGVPDLFAEVKVRRPRGKRDGSVANVPLSAVAMVDDTRRQSQRVG